ncbi:hypothetical protein ACFLUJ_00010 [Chloroflexota bacterium]
MRKRIVLLCAAVSLFLIGSLAGNLLTNITLANPVDSVSIPQIINYQGLLTDKGTGSPLEGTVNITFSLYELPSGGSSVWEEIHTGVNVSHDLFNVQLGSINPIDTSHLTGESYLGVKVGADTEMTPRQSLASVPYAFHAENANTLDGIDSTNFVTITGDNMTGPLSVNATIESTSGGFKFPDGSIQTTAGGDRVKRLIHDFVVASGENVTAGDIVTFFDGYVQKGFVIGDNISYGSEYVFNSAITSIISAAPLSSTKFVVAYRDVGNSNYGTAIIGDVSGTTITYGSKYVFDAAAAYDISVAALSSTKFVVAYRDVGNSNYGTAIIGDVSGTTITYGSEYVFNAATTVYISATALSSTKFVVIYRDGGNSDYGTAIIGDVSAGNIVGIAGESGAEGETVTVIIDGVSNVHSGLTPGEVYYATPSGDLTTDLTDYEIGLAISENEILR